MRRVREMGSKNDGMDYALGNDKSRKSVDYQSALNGVPDMRITKLLHFVLHRRFDYQSPAISRTIHQ